MSVTVKIPTPLRPVTSGQSEIRVEGATVGEVLRKLDGQFKGFGERVYDANGIKRFINVFVNEEKGGLDTEVKPGDTISILPSIAGGIEDRGSRDFSPPCEALKEVWPRIKKMKRYL